MKKKRIFECGEVRKKRKIAVDVNYHKITVDSMDYHEL